MSTSARDNVPRNGQGKWRRQIANVERDAQAARLASMGWSHDRIAAELGYSDRGDAWRGSRRALAELAQANGADELRQQQIASNKELRERLWQIVNDPPPLVSRTGKVVVDEASGERIPDAQAVIGAAATILRADERLSRLTGLDAPRKSLTMTVSQGLEQMREAWLQEKGYDPLSPETKEAYRAWLEDDAPLELGGTLRMPRLSEMPEDERDGILASIREVNQRGVAEGALLERSGQPGRRAIPGHVMTDDI